MPARIQDHDEAVPRLTKNIDPKEAKISVDARATKVLTRATTLSLSDSMKGRRSIVTSIMPEAKSIIRDGISVRAIETASPHSNGPIEPDAALCLIVETLKERRIIVAPSRKLVIIISLRPTMSMLGAGFSNPSQCSDLALY